MKRYPEKETMETVEESKEFDKTTRSYSYFMHVPIANEVIKRSRSKRFRSREIKILDIGGGNARIAIKIARKNKHVKIFLLELSNNMLKIAEKNINKEKVHEKIHGEGRQILQSRGERLYPHRTFNRYRHPGRFSCRHHPKPVQICR